MPIDYSHQHFAADIMQDGSNPHTPISSVTQVVSRIGPLVVAWDTAIDGDGFSARLATIPAGSWVIYGGIVIRPGDAWVSTGFSSGVVVFAADPAEASTNVKQISDLSALPDIADYTYIVPDVAPNPNVPYQALVDIGVYWHPGDDPATAGSLDIFVFTVS